MSEFSKTHAIFALVLPYMHVVLHNPSLKDNRLLDNKLITRGFSFRFSMYIKEKLEPKTALYRTDTQWSNIKNKTMMTFFH